MQFDSGVAADIIQVISARWTRARRECILIATFDSGVAADIIQVIQALVLTFVAAPAIIRWLFRLRIREDEIDQALKKLKNKCEHGSKPI